MWLPANISHIKDMLSCHRDMIYIRDMSHIQDVSDCDMSHFWDMSHMRDISQLEISFSVEIYHGLEIHHIYSHMSSFSLQDKWRCTECDTKNTPFVGTAWGAWQWGVAGYRMNRGWHSGRGCTIKDILWKGPCLPPVRYPTSSLVHCCHHPHITQLNYGKGSHAILSRSHSH